MQRARVAAVSAPLSVVETLVPSVAGLVVFGDRVRPGWEPAVVVGAVLALAGIAAVSAAVAPAVPPERVLP